MVDLKGEDSLYWHAAWWRRAQGLPDKVFVKSVQEVKPLPLDFSDLSSLGVFTLAVRKLRQGGAGTVTLSELLPDGRGYWLTDSAGDGEAARRLPRLALWLLCLAYVLPDFVGRQPWKGNDLTSDRKAHV